MSLATDLAATRRTCYLGFVVQAIAIHFAPLLFLTFESAFSLGVSDMAWLIGVGFAVQLAVDLLSVLFLARVHPRVVAVSADLLVAAGLCGMATLPFCLPARAGLLLSVALCGAGGGLTEVLVSPLCETCRPPDGAGGIALPHAFYCFGQAGVILLSVLFFAAFGIGRWRLLACLLALLPLACGALFAVVPLPMPGDAAGGTPLRALWRRPAFLRLLLMMAAAGAAEMTMGQWASAFAEAGLGVSKTVGDLLGPCLFALSMGAARSLGGRLGDRIPLSLLLSLAAALCAGAYLLAAFAPVPFLALLGCGACGFAVGVLWPGVYRAASDALPEGGVSMFSFLALAGDVGCLGGPAAAGAIAAATGGDLRPAFFAAAAFPLAFFAVTVRSILENAGKKP